MPPLSLVYAAVTGDFSAAVKSLQKPVARASTAAVRQGADLLKARAQVDEVASVYIGNAKASQLISQFSSADVVRHPLVARIVDAYDKAALKELQEYAKGKTGVDVKLADIIAATTPGFDTPEYLRGV